MNGFVVAYAGFFLVVGIIGMVVVLFLLCAFASALLRWVTEAFREGNGPVD
jgi:hypothetical protein